MALVLPLAFGPSLAPFIALLAFGFIVAVFGHITGSNGVVIIGLIIIFLATVVLPLLAFGNPY